MSLLNSLIYKPGESPSKKLKEYYDKLTMDTWQGNQRRAPVFAPNTAAPIPVRRDIYQRNANTLTGIELTKTFRSGQPKVLKALQQRYAPILGTDPLGTAVRATYVATRTLGINPNGGTLYADNPKLGPLDLGSIGRLAGIVAGADVPVESLRRRFALDHRVSNPDFGYEKYWGVEKNGLWEDLIPVEFRDDTETHRVRGIIAGLSDNIAPTWNETQYVGRPDSVVSYGGFKREMSFSLTLAATHPAYLRPMWITINKLAQFVLPRREPGTTRFAGQLCHVTVGSFLQDELCAMTAFAIKPSEDAYWEIDDPMNYPPNTLVQSPTDKLSAVKSNRGPNGLMGQLSDPNPKQQKIPNAIDKEGNVKRNRFIMPRVVTLEIGLKVLGNDIPGRGGAPLYPTGNPADTKDGYGEAPDPTTTDPGLSDRQVRKRIRQEQRRVKRSNRENS